MRAHRGAFDLDRAGRQAGETKIAAAAGPDGSDDGTVGEDTAHAGSSVETGVCKQLADDERLGLLRSEFLGNGRGSTQNARTDNDGNARQHRQLHSRHESEVSKIS